MTEQEQRRRWAFEQVVQVVPRGKWESASHRLQWACAAAEMLELWVQRAPPPSTAPLAPAVEAPEPEARDAAKKRKAAP